MNALIIGEDSRETQAFERAFTIFGREWSFKRTKALELSEQDLAATDILVIVRDDNSPVNCSELISRVRQSPKNPIIVIYETRSTSYTDLHEADWLIKGAAFDKEFFKRLLAQGEERAKRPARVEYNPHISLLTNNPQIRDLLHSLGFTVQLGSKEPVVFVHGLERDVLSALTTARTKHPEAFFIGIDNRYSFSYGIGSVEDLSHKYLDAGCDYFFDKHQIDINILHRFVAGLQHGEPPPELMYGLVGSGNTFEQRAEQTAKTEEELRFILKQLRKHGCQTVLDGGCGNGRLAIPLAQAGYKVLGVDLSEQQLRVAQSRAGFNPNLHFLKADLAHLNLQQESFDAIILMWHVLAEFPPDEQELVLSKMLKLLRPPARDTKGLGRLFTRPRNDGILIFDLPDSSNTYVQKAKRSGVPVGSTLKYHGHALSLHETLQLLQKLRAPVILHRHVHWGVDKHVFVIQKWGWH